VPELHLLVALATTGAGVVALASHVVTMMLGLEIAAVSYTAAVAWRRDAPDAIEAAVKLLVLGAVGSSFVLFGASLAYAATGSLAVSGLAQAGLLPAALVAIGVAIKAGAAPFHAWVADAWHGTTGPVALLLGTTAKAGLLAAALHAWPQGERGGLVALAVLSMLGGALLGLNQTRVRRVLAASSVNHMGDLLLGVAVGGAAGQQAVGLYLVGYALTQIALFAWLERWAGVEELDELGALSAQGGGDSGWGWTVAVASLAGLPFTAGFVGKLALVQAAVGAGLVGPALALAVGSVISGGAYLRLLGPVGSPREIGSGGRPFMLWFARAATLAVLALGVAPAWWVGWVALFL
jgi:NADH-quinone oxidoreductase subunit N